MLSRILAAGCDWWPPIAELTGSKVPNGHHVDEASRVGDSNCGSSAQPILIRNYVGEIPVIDGSGLTVPSGGRQGLVGFTDCSHLVFQGFEVTAFTTTDGGRIPIGIQVDGSGTGLQLIGNKVHHIWQSSTDGCANGFGISVYGTPTTSTDGIVLDRNEVFDLRTGQSESVVLNGNVVNFVVRNNVVHDCNNIGIDFIGYEGSAPAGFDRARDGQGVGNTVYLTIRDSRGSRLALFPLRSTFNFWHPRFVGIAVNHRRPLRPVRMRGIISALRGWQTGAWMSGCTSS